MMSLALPALRGSFPLFPRLFQRPSSAWTVSRPAILLSTFLAFPSLNSLLELFPSIAWAVPKKKVSHSRKAMRSAHKGLKDKSNIVSCPGCGSAKLAHHLCANCYSQISREYKRQARELGDGGIKNLHDIA